MNKIVVNEDNSFDINLDSQIILKKNVENEITELNLKFNADTDLEIIYNNKENKYNIIIEVEENVTAKILEIRSSQKQKIQNKYYLKRYSNLEVIKFYDCSQIKEMDLIYLGGEYANINYTLKTISKEKQKFDIIVYHNCSNTISNIYNNGANIKDGILDFNITSIVNNGIKGCKLNQDSRILILNNNKCNINPNLLIEENDVEANHSASIGTFSNEVLFYLQSRGIEYEKAINLLVRGFLTTNLNNEFINQIINKYWR
ncbi:MAG: SufD family Fe-S cluster assembly protein [Bacilli bacterium]